MKKRIFLVCMASCLVIMLGGCRYSETIEQMIHSERHEGLIDYSPPVEMTWNSEQNDEFSNDLKDLIQEEEAERDTMREELGGDIEKDETDTEEGYSVAFDSDGEHSTEVSTTETGDTGDGASSDSVSEDGAAGTENDADGKGDESGVPGSTSPENEKSDGKDAISGEGGESPKAGKDSETDKKVVDENGEDPETPENVYKIAATGELASMLLILGDADALVATDADTVARAGQIGAFSSLGSAQPLWNGSGEAGLSEEGLAGLIELKPDAVIETSGSGALSDAQVAKLQANDINYMVVPAPTSLDNINTTMTVLGEVLAGQDADAPVRAKEYVDWVGKTLERVENAVSGRQEPAYTLYIDNWDAGAVVSEFGYSSMGCAMVLPKSHTFSQTVTGLLSYAGVSNTTGLSSYDDMAENYYYVTPLASQSGLLSVSGSAANTTKSRYFSLLGPVTYVFGSDSKSGTESVIPVNLGSSNFHYVVAADQNTRNAILASKAEANGQWTLYPPATSSAFSTQAGFLVGDELVISAVLGDYEVLVNPQGYESWTEGSCESILETVWAAWAIAGVLEESEARAYIQEFYSVFYQYPVSDAEITQILQGK